MESGLSEDSKFLSHWFDLTPAGNAPMGDKVPRPSPWNYFATETRDIHVPAIEEAKSKARLTMPADQDNLRSFAEKQGLSEDSKFLSHWFGLTKPGDMDASAERLPRPSAWNCFVKVPAAEVQVSKNGYALRKFAMESGLSEDSKFLSHWFGLTPAGDAPMGDKMPRPSPWNYFATETRDIHVPAIEEAKSKARLTMPADQDNLRSF